ncbi:hypothetical protein PQQ75_01190 [Paraburkholderia aspalathi]|uniref:hypothetical protein n=1 Tax=Paraburkholderia aspalathi TaxID=1324617 RepID=UPI0038B8262E
MNQPLHAGQQRLSDCVDMAITGKADPMAVKRIERETQALLNKGAGQPEISWLILAFTAFFQGKASECIRFVEAASKLAPYDVTVVGNAGSLLAGVGEPRRASEFVRRQAGMAVDDKRQLLFCSLNFRKVLLFEEAADIMRTYGGAEGEAFKASAQQLADIALERGISPDMRMALLEVAIATVRDQGCSIRHVGLTQYPDNSLRYVLFIDESASQCGNVNFAIAEALTEKFEDTHAEFITFACRPLSSYDVDGTFIEVAR